MLGVFVHMCRREKIVARKTTHHILHSPRSSAAQRSVHNNSHTAGVVWGAGSQLLQFASQPSAASWCCQPHTTMSIVKLKEARRLLDQIMKREVGKAMAKPGEMAAVTGHPLSAFGNRVVTIYTPSRNPMQSGRANTNWQGAERGGWRLHLEPSTKWTNPLIGWTSTSDALEHVLRGPGMFFQSKDEAVQFCMVRGWPYRVEEPPPVSEERPKRYNSYGDNFSVKRKGVPVGGLRSELQAAPAAPPAAAAPTATPTKGKRGKAAAAAAAASSS